MKYPMILAIGVCLLFASAPVMVGQTEDGDIAFLKRTMEENAMAWKSGNADVINKYDHPGYNSFGSGGGLLWEGGGGPEALRQRFENGLKVDIEYRHLQVKVHGNTGVVTCYIIGTITRPGSEEPTAVANRMTSVWAKENGEWKWVHDHASPLKFE